jgi:hypothetical protein
LKSSRLPLRERISSKYLDWAEVLPKFNGGIIHHLQEIRERQRVDAQKAYAETRSPQEIFLHLDGFLMVEIFLIEDFAELKEQLEKLFPQGSASLDGLGANRLEEFFDSANDLLSRRTQFIGHLTRKKVNSFFYPSAVAQLHGLPEEVTEIQVELLKILPSVFVVSFDVILDSKATTRVRELLNMTYLPSFNFGGVLPTRLNLYRNASGSSQKRMQDEIDRFFADLRLRIEKPLRSKIHGMFLECGRTRSPQLPSVQMLSISGVQEDESINAWERLRKYSAWMGCFGFAHWKEYMTYSDASLLIQVDLAPAERIP